MKKAPRSIPVLFVRPRKQPVPPIGPQLERIVSALDSAGLRVVPK